MQMAGSKSGFWQNPGRQNFFLLDINRIFITLTKIKAEADN